MKKLFLLLALITTTAYGKSFSVLGKAYAAGASSSGGNTLGLNCSDGQFPSWSAGGFNTCSTPISSVAWGSITGTLSDQTDLNTALAAKAPLTSPTFVTSARFNYATATTVPYLDANKDLVSSAVTPTELGYVSGVTSAIQTQLGTKAPTASPTFTGTVTTAAGAAGSGGILVGADIRLYADADDLFMSVGGVNYGRFGTQYIAWTGTGLVCDSGAAGGASCMFFPNAATDEVVLHGDYFGDFSRGGWVRAGGRSHATVGEEVWFGAGSSTALAKLKATGLFVNVDLVGDGGDQLYGFLQNQVASTTTTLTAAQCGSSIISDSADVVTLPEASTVLGCEYTFICGTNDDFDINPNDGTDQILGFSYAAAGATAALAPAAGDAIRCTDAGASLVMEAVGANAWAVIGVANGLWADVN